LIALHVNLYGGTHIWVPFRIPLAPFDTQQGCIFVTTYYYDMRSMLKIFNKTLSPVLLMFDRKV